MDTPAPPPFPPAVRALVRAFRSQRPLRGGSLLVTIFGDSIAPRGGAVMLGSLIALAAPFGLTERLVRTSVARLAREGWLTAVRAGRRSEYRLSHTGARRFAEATQRIYGPAPTDWDGHWTLVLLPPAAQAAQARSELHWLGFGQIAPSVLAHPGASLGQARGWLAGIEGAAQAALLAGQAPDEATARALVSRGWDLKELRRRYARFCERFAGIEAQCRGRDVPPGQAFLVRTLLIHEYRKIHLQDPLLPVRLLPAAWEGADAYQITRRIYRAVFARADEYLTRSAARLAGPLPAVEPAAFGRFGGLPRG